jgi:hypothetical protein
MYKRVVTKRAMQGETVEIQWTLVDNTIYYERYTCPPKEVREARIKERLAITETLSGERLPSDRKDREPSET